MESSNPPRKWKSLLTIGIVLPLIAVGGAVAIRALLVRSATDTAMPPLRTSPFTNTQADVAYVGAQTCKSCHEDAHTSFMQTAHSKALMEVDLQSEPPEGEFSDPKSKKTYRITHRDGKMIHGEYLNTDDGEELLLAEFPIRYTIGSGRFSRSYLVEIDNFLYESPATWYAARPGWALSPGYENFNSGFQRPVEARCVACHAGRIEAVDNSPQRVNFHALVIDCERCHGPGSQHVAKWSEKPQSVTESNEKQEIDYTIVNPAHLERRLCEDICAQCHLHSAATIENPERRLQDFRPGQWLTDFVTYYGHETPAKEMNVVGHTEQMRLSKCYQKSETLTCTTCHNPHSKPSATEAATMYRATCLSCHEEQSCGETQEKRLAKNLADNCISCHMPSTNTEIPHFAFTHHRIGIHDQGPEEQHQDGMGELVPLDDVTLLPKAIQKRNLGLAYLQFSDAPGQSPFAPHYRARAQLILATTERLDQADPEVLAALSRLYWNVNAAEAVRFGELAGEAKALSPEAEATIAFTLGTTYFSEGRIDKAQPWLIRTTQLRPTADVWFMLSQSYEQFGDRDSALAAARRAVTLASDRPRFLQHLITLLKQQGYSTESVILEPRLDPLLQYRKNQTP